MIMKRITLASLAMALLFVFNAMTVQAQFPPPEPQQEISEVTDAELQLFVDASIKAQQIQTESQMEMIAIVQEEGLEVDTYNQILQGLQNGQSPEQMEVSSTDVEKFHTASELIGEVEQDMETKLISAIEDEGLELERFQQIFMAIQSDPGLQQKMQQLIQQYQTQ